MDQTSIGTMHSVKPPPSLFIGEGEFGLWKIIEERESRFSCKNGGVNPYLGVACGKGGYTLSSFVMVYGLSS